MNKKVWHLPFFRKLERPSNESGNKSRTEWIKSRTERIEKILQTAPKNEFFKLYGMKKKYFTVSWSFNNDFQWSPFQILGFRFQK